MIRPPRARTPGALAAAWAAGCLLSLRLLSPAAAAAPLAPPAQDPAALRAEGDPILAYDLGVAAHRLGRLPEAILWYRRAARPGLADLWPDPWLAENLAQARQALGLGPPRPRGIAFWAAHEAELELAGVLLAWGALALHLARRPAGATGRPRASGSAAGAVLAMLAVLAAASFGAGAWLARRGPRAAVLLAPCGGLSAGSEVWGVWSEPGPARFQVSGGGPACPASAIGLVEPLVEP